MSLLHHRYILKELCNFEPAASSSACHGSSTFSSVNNIPPSCFRPPPPSSSNNAMVVEPPGTPSATTTATRRRPYTGSTTSAAALVASPLPPSVDTVVVPHRAMLWSWKTNLLTPAVAASGVPGVHGEGGQGDCHMGHHRPPLPLRLQYLPLRRATTRTHQASAGDRRTVPSDEPERNGLFGFTGDVEPVAPHTAGGTFVHFANSKKNEDNDKAVKVYKRRGGCCWDSKELEQPATFEELGMDPETNGINSDLLTFVMEKESHKKVGKAWTRCYVLYEPPGTDRSSLIGAMANYLKFDIYNVDLMSLSSISELKEVLGSTRNHSLIAIRDYNLWLGFPQPKNQPGMDGEPIGQNQEANVFRRDFMEGPIAMNTESGLIMVLRPPDQYGERNTSTACEAPPHNVHTGIEVLRPPDPHGEKNPSPMFKTPSTIGQITVENEMGSQNPEPNEFQLDNFEDMNFRNTETGSMAEMPSDWEDLLALEEEPFPERNVSGSINLTVVACSDTTPCQQPMPTISDTMPPIRMMPHLACSDPAPCQQPMLTISNTMPTIHMLPHFAAREDMRFVTLKVTYGKEKILKFMFPLMSGIMELKEEVKKRLKLELGSFDIKYEDEEGDRIFLACDEDLRYHLQLFSNQVIRLLVVDSDANTLDFC
ncbi:hypothetical protein RHGRI_038689 [Rhododendron griersonianum]|uniref:PB1 domain-containing protein n=1 Tax=Rhododendron griersonianum TaxID=479676 RepID=A0AAV6HLZ3_9ERIC|nr:hypothetical protein RHGRI_038689 [Rhododendron griersonianum]